ncbi:MAG: tetratricopeptide repeat protein [Spirochaetaceae bacterium]|jgi:tetratricopeptide (TPR) repeat protein|nr:tetratricopeptide repeat protein [Spirochaetaceae bacterium]
MNIKPAFLFLCCLTLSGLLFSCVSQSRAAKAAEYYALGMAYFDLGRYDEAEKWLNQAKSLDKTKLASEYNLGRIAFETGRYEEAIKIFDGILKRDPDNLMILKAAAYSRIKTGEFDEAEKLYEQVLSLVPESADDGYNYALVLNAIKKPDKAEEILAKYPFALLDNKDVLLLYARSQGAQNKPEAVDSYNQWLINNSDSQVQYEFALVLEKNGLYARSLEEYRKILTSLPADTVDDQNKSGSELRKSTIQFSIARLLLSADPENPDGLTELDLAVSEGYSDTEALNKLLDDEKVTDSAKEAIRKIIDELEKDRKDNSTEGTDEGL